MDLNEFQNSVTSNFFLICLELLWLKTYTNYYVIIHCLIAYLDKIYVIKKSRFYKTHG